MTELHERVAALEEAQRINESNIVKILNKVESIDAHLNKYKGFFGAIWLIISCIGIALSAWKYIK